MKLSKTMQNVLEAIQAQTIKMRGKNKGDVKRRISCKEYYENTVLALERRGLIDFEFRTIHGSGWAATYKSLNVG